MRLVTLDEVPGPDGQPLFVDFVNTLHWYEGAPIELIGTETDFVAWALEHGMSAEAASGRLPEVHLLREHVRGVITALAARQPLPDGDIAALQAALSAPTGGLRLVDAAAGRAHLAFGTDVADGDLFNLRIALSVAAFLRSPLRARLKLCANPGCGFAFVDTSTNATRRWCFMRSCGNRLKVRAYRGRQRPAAQPSTRGRVGRP